MKREPSMYIVKISSGSCDDYHEIDVFATDKKSTATKYVTKFNKILKKWSEYYKRYEDDERSSIKWIKDEFVQQHFNRWNILRETNNCLWTEIKIR